MTLQLVLQLISLFSWLAKASAVEQEAYLGCPSTCGNIKFLYPFGIGKDCSNSKWYEVTCNNSFNPPKAFLKAKNLEIVQMFPEMLVNIPVIISTCNDSNEMVRSSINLEGSPFSFSKDGNVFATMGCDNKAFISEGSHVVGGCNPLCRNDSATGRGCFGDYCCQAPISSSLQVFNVTITSKGGSSTKGKCKFAFLVDKYWFSRYLQNPYEIQQMGYVPVMLDWGIENGTCKGNTICGPNTDCENIRFFSHRCKCKEGYKRNPYLNSICEDVDECVEFKDNRCATQGLKCRNTEGSYTCIDQIQSMTKVVALGVGVGLGGALLCLLASLRFYQVLKERRNRKIRKKFFERNGGLLLQQQVSSEEGNVERTKIFTTEELEKATDHYNENRILGYGGQGTVYKGMLPDGSIVAIKKSKIVNEGQTEQFINELVILSHINHRNVVKLLGCCLETEVPLLVYEFISNGTLFHHIHEKSEEFLSSWDNRLRIAIEVAGALAYLHSAASIPIYHRDIKSTNILIDGKYTAKVSDFGISRSVPIDKTHLTTSVQGTFGYMDPEYFQSNQFTEKSDVYSFGVVLVELLTSEKPISSTKSEEEMSLATHFLSSVRENHLFEVLDAQVVKDGRKEELEVVANLARRCLNLNGRKRPTMKEVAMDLEGLRMSQEHFPVLQYSEEECFINDLSGVWDVGSISIEFSTSEK